MKLPSLLTILAAGLSFTPLALADTTIAYPAAEKPDFTITAPDDWHFEAGSEENPYCTLSKGDTILYFRSVKGKIEDAVEEAYAHVQETYPDAELPEAKDTKIDGKEALGAAGSGKDKDGVLTQFGFAWVFFGDEKIAELWFESAETDKKVALEAQKILKSFKAKAK